MDQRPCPCRACTCGASRRSGSLWSCDAGFRRSLVVVAAGFAPAVAGGCGGRCRRRRLESRVWPPEVLASASVSSLPVASASVLRSPAAPSGRSRRRSLGGRRRAPCGRRMPRSMQRPYERERRQDCDWSRLTSVSAHKTSLFQAVYQPGPIFGHIEPRRITAIRHRAPLKGHGAHQDHGEMSRQSRGMSCVLEREAWHGARRPSGQTVRTLCAQRRQAAIRSRCAGRTGRSAWPRPDARDRRHAPRP